MTLAAEKGMEHLGETTGVPNHVHDLIHDLSRRLDALWRYDQYIANAEWRESLRNCWSELKAQEQQNIQRLKQLLADEIRAGGF